MKYDNVKQLSEVQFRRITGVKPITFNKMLEVVQIASETKKTLQKGAGGRPHKLSLEDRLLMTLEYLREYRTYAHIAASYSISESKAFENIRWIEDTLIRSKEFRLPGKKALLKSDFEFEVLLVDATETPIERPKKNNVNSTLEKRSAIL